MSKRESIEEYVRKGRKIMAIKIYREASSVGLKDAKDAVESYMSSGSWSPDQLRALGETGSSRAPAANPLKGGPYAAAEAFIHGGKKINAIKEIRQVTSFGLREAKSAVESFMSTGTWPAEMSALDGKVEEPAQETPPLDLSEVELQVTSGKKIKAIKELRRLIPTMGLKVAKKTVEHYMAHGTWPATLVGATSTPAKPVPAPTPAAAPEATPKPIKPIKSSKPAVGAGDPEASAATQALMSHLGSGEVDSIHPTKKNLFGGYLALVGDRAFFLVQRFGSWELDGEYAKSESLGVELRTSFSRIELRLRAGYLQDTFTGLDEDTARSIAERLGG